MSAIPNLKKKLKSVRATGKLAKAMKTVSAAKFSKLSVRQRYYSQYAEQFRFLYGGDDGTSGEGIDTDCVIVMGSNRGFCGGFNIEILNYLNENVLKGSRPEHLIAVGEELSHRMTDSQNAPDRTFIFGDIPTMSECEELFTLLESFAGDKENYKVKIVYPSYKNTLTQIPKSEILTVNASNALTEADDVLWVPDRETVLREFIKHGSRTLLFGKVLETAVGAQAATLMTMRSAYDTATSYSEALEGEIHRIRQSEVTADVIETSSERRSKGDETNG